MNNVFCFEHISKTKTFRGKFPWFRQNKTALLLQITLKTATNLFLKNWKRFSCVNRIIKIQRFLSPVECWKHKERVGKKLCALHALVYIPSIRKAVLNILKIKRKRERAVETTMHLWYLIWKSFRLIIGFRPFMCRCLPFLVKLLLFSVHCKIENIILRIIFLCKWMKTMCCSL